MSWRAAAGAVLFLAGLTVGSVAEPRPGAAGPRGLQVLVADFHVHSFPGDGVLPPSVIAREAPRHRVDVIGLTNHNAMLSWRFAARTGPGDALVLPGEEVTSVGFHIAAIGVRTVVPWHEPAADVVAQIHQQGGIAIAAHPTSDSWPYFDDRALDGLDGVEAAHPLMLAFPDSATELAAFYRRATVRHPGIAAIGSTDFHFLWPVGLCRTYVFATDRTEAAVLQAVRAGRTVACDGAGRAYGPPRLVALVSDLCARDVRASRAFRSNAETWATVCALAGLLLVALG